MVLQDTIPIPESPLIAAWRAHSAASGHTDAMSGDGIAYCMECGWWFAVTESLFTHLEAVEGDDGWAPSATLWGRQVEADAWADRVQS